MPSAWNWLLPALMAADMRATRKSATNHWGIRAVDIKGDYLVQVSLHGMYGQFRVRVVEERVRQRPHRVGDPVVQRMNIAVKGTERLISLSDLSVMGNGR